MNKIEMELITSEVTLVRAAMRLRAFDAPPVVAQAYERIADHMHPVGYYQFEPMEAAHISLALKEFSDISGEIGLSELAIRAKDLSDDFLRECFAISPLDEACRLISQVDEPRKEGVPHEVRPLGFIPRAAAVVGITRVRASNQMRSL